MDYIFMGMIAIMIIIIFFFVFTARIYIKTSKGSLNVGVEIPKIFKIYFRTSWDGNNKKVHKSKKKSGKKKS